MTGSDLHAPGAAIAAGLPRLAPDPQRAERVRARCRARLARSRRHSMRMAAVTGRATQVFAAAVIAAFCVLYVLGLVTTTLRVEGLQ